jgi:hypothetical protein
MSNNAGLVVLLCDHTQQHMAIEVAPLGATEIELAAIAHNVSERLGYTMGVYTTMATRDHPRAVEQARNLLRFNQQIA